MVNKISAGAVQTKIKILFSVFLFMDITSFNKYNGEEDTHRYTSELLI